MPQKKQLSDVIAIHYIGRVKPTRQGRTYKIKTIGGKFTTYTVAPKCTENKGIWFCITHTQSFLNQFGKDYHFHVGKHELAWICFSHGPEVP